MPRIHSLAFVINAGKPGASSLARELMAIARKQGARMKNATRLPLRPGFLRGCDACCVIGGDGTLLAAARDAALAGVPIIGVNRGNLGFLTTFSPDEARAHFARVLAGHFRLERRAMLTCAVGAEKQDLALNDVLIKSEMHSKLVRLEVFADDQLVTEYSCDGLILSTATGSTAYNLSAGGPIIHPAARVIAMTPICPHTLSNRSVILREGVKLRLFNRSKGSGVIVSLDGQREHRVRAGVPVRISMSRLRLSLVQPVGYEHFSVVRTKLNWSGGGPSKK